MAESAQMLRQWRLLQMFSARKYGIALQEMADETEFSTRTLLRDLQVLKAAGFPLIEDVGERGKKRWRLSNDIGIAQLHFTLEEAAALYLGRQFIEAFAGTLFWSGAQRAYQKIRAALNEPAIQFTEKVAEAVHLTQEGRVDYSERVQLIDDLLMAIEDRKLTVITYQSLRSTEPVTFYDVHPYSLVFHKWALYLIAWSLDHDEIGTFKIDRISEAEVQSGVMTFTRPRDFDAARHLENSFGIFSDSREPQTIRVRFAPKVVRILKEKTFHPSQTLHIQKDGSAIAKFRLSTFEEFRSWILSFGRHAKILEPDELATSIRQEIEQMQAIYTSEEREHV